MKADRLRAVKAFEKHQRYSSQPLEVSDARSHASDVFWLCRGNLYHLLFVIAAAPLEPAW
jgi:hypothetical protein